VSTARLGLTGTSAGSAGLWLVPHCPPAVSADYDNWSNAQLQAALGDANFQATIATWWEQRHFGFDYVLQALAVSNHPLGPQLAAAWQVAPPAQPNPSGSGWSPATPGQPITTPR
jgi:hypothetical protein